ncbi:hypothetical protein BDZ91DRAFT_798926 [Kalaharituber pfeilii]|nr:hypothetical protein BDZ91DRAFT_798926 [Kalaharituber pfeilii]
MPSGPGAERLEVPASALHSLSVSFFTLEVHSSVRLCRPEFTGRSNVVREIDAACKFDAASEFDTTGEFGTAGEFDTAREFDAAGEFDIFNVSLSAFGVDIQIAAETGQLGTHPGGSSGRKRPEGMKAQSGQGSQPGMQHPGRSSMRKRPEGMEAQSGQGRQPGMQMV